MLFAETIVQLGQEMKKSGSHELLSHFIHSLLKIKCKLFSPKSGVKHVKY